MRLVLACWRGLRRRRVQSWVAVQVRRWARIFFRVSASGGLLWWELQRRKRDGQRVGDVLGAGVVGGEFEAGPFFFRVCGWVWMFWWELRRRNRVLTGIDGE